MYLGKDTPALKLEIIVIKNQTVLSDAPIKDPETQAPVRPEIVSRLELYGLFAPAIQVLIKFFEVLLVMQIKIVAS
jgi:hypothetical protein